MRHRNRLASSILQSTETLLDSAINVTRLNLERGPAPGGYLRRLLSRRQRATLATHPLCPIDIRPHPIIMKSRMLTRPGQPHFIRRHHPLIPRHNLDVIHQLTLATHIRSTCPTSRRPRRRSSRQTNSFINRTLDSPTWALGRPLHSLSDTPRHSNSPTPNCIDPTRRTVPR